MSKVSILHMIGSRPIGGIGSFLKQLDGRYDRTRFEISYIYNITNDDQSFDKLVLSNGSNVYHMPNAKGGLLKFIKFLLALNRFYSDNSKKIDILHVHVPYLGFFHMLIAKFYGIKLRIVHSHSTQYSDFYIRAMRNRIVAIFTLALSTHRMACAQDAGRVLFGSKYFKIQNNCISISEFAFSNEDRLRYRRMMNIGNNEVAFISVANFNRVKNHQFMIEIFNNIIKLNKNSSLFLVGHGEEEEQIRRIVKQKKLEDKIFFLGKREDVPQLLSMADAVLLPSLFEGFPVTIVEAQAAGVRCFVSSIVDKTVNITGLVEFISLGLAAKDWARKIIDSMDIVQPDRIGYAKKVKENGYDISDGVKELESFYLSLFFEKHH